MKNKPESQDLRIKKLKELAHKTLEFADWTADAEAIPELALFRVPATREHLIEQGKFSPKEIKALDLLAEKHANLEAEQTASKAKQRFVSGLRIDNEADDPKPKD